MDQYVCPRCTKKLRNLDEDTSRRVIIRGSFDLSQPGKYSDEAFLKYYGEKHHDVPPTTYVKRKLTNRPITLK